MSETIAEIKGEEETKNASRSLIREGTEMRAPIKMKECGWGGK